MAARAIWKGSIKLHSLMQVPIAIYKATDGYDGVVPLRQVDAETKQPFRREERNSKGKLRMTQEALKNGATSKTHVAMVKAVEVAEGDFRVVPQAQLDAISSAFENRVIEIHSVLDYDLVPMAWVGETFFVKHDKAMAGAEEAVATLHAALAADRRVIIGRWSHHGHENIVAIHALDGTLVCNRILFAQEVRDDADFVIDADVDDEAVEMTSSLLTQYECAAFDHGTFEDGAVARRMEVIDAVLSGSVVEGPEEPGEVAAPSDLVAALKASLNASKPKAKKAPAKKPAAKKPARKPAAKKAVRS